MGSKKKFGSHSIQTAPKFGAVFFNIMKQLTKYFIVYVYGMVMLIVISLKQNNSTASTDYNRQKTDTKISVRKEVKTIPAQKFYGSNQKFAVSFSDYPFSFMY